jgi:hypothetical protein
VDLLISIFRAAGVFATAIREWEFKPEDQKSVDKFMIHFIQANDYRCKHEASLKDNLEANVAALPPPPDNPPPTPAALALSNTTGHPSLNGFAYCWTHGVCNHPGNECKSPAKGHGRAQEGRNCQGPTRQIQRHLQQQEMEERHGRIKK